MNQFEFEIENPATVNVTYNAEQHQLTIGRLVFTCSPEKTFKKDMTCKLILQGSQHNTPIADTVELRQIPQRGVGKWELAPNPYQLLLPQGVEQELATSNGQGYWLVAELNPPNDTVEMGRISLAGIVSPSTTAPSTSSSADLVDSLQLLNPHAVDWGIDSQNLQVWIDRVEIQNQNPQNIPSGLRAKIGLLKGIDQRYTLKDTDVLPTFAAQRVTAIGPFQAPLPRDVANSQDRWQLELYLIDEQNDQHLLYLSPKTSIVG